MSKSTSKSCSCRQCQHAKHTTAGNKIIKQGERAFRHASKIALRQGADDLLPAGRGERIG